MRADASIGIFDSGFGGLTVMRQVRALLPYENMLYFGDTARLPYGNKNSNTILRYTVEGASFLVEQGIKALVIACHTACSAAAVEQLRNLFPIPIISIVEESIEEVVHSSSQGKVAILATRATILSEIYQKNLSANLPHAKLQAIACPLFVPLVEEGYISHPLSSLAAHEYLSQLRSQPVDTVLLGCTHYPLLRPVIQQELGETVRLIDPSQTCAQKLKNILESQNLCHPYQQTPSYTFYVSDDPNKFQSLGSLFLNHPITSVHCVHSAQAVSS